MAKYDYIKTDWWKQFRKEIRKERKVCEICGTDKKLNVHHRHYKTVGKETPEDVYLLCEWHHKRLHQLSKKIDCSYDQAFDILKKNPQASPRRFRKKKKKRRFGKEYKIKEWRMSPEKVKHYSEIQRKETEFNRMMLERRLNR